MKHTKITTILLIASTLLLGACHKDKIMSFNFNATMEQPTNDDGSKVFLNGERFVFWEEGDNITVASDRGYWHLDDPSENKYATATLVDVGNTSGDVNEDFHFFNGVFITTLLEGSQYFIGAYPKFTVEDVPNWCTPSEGSSHFGTTVKIKTPLCQPVRTSLTASGNDISDYSFDKNVFPMIAWYGGTWSDTTTAFNLDFHSLASIVRVQLYNVSGEDAVLDSIEFTSRDGKQLSGVFEVENYKTEDPNLKASSGDNRIVIAQKASGNTRQSLGITLDATALRSFYLVLPAYHGRHETTTYSLTMTIHATRNGTPYTFARDCTIGTRRNGITYMPAISINNWSAHTTLASIPGNGTIDRPFKIYDADGLIYLRYCYNSTHRINNQPIDGFTNGGPYIRIMRSDIVLNTTNWAADGGIRNFKGTMTYATSGTNTQQALTNNSGKPLFHSIGANGHVEGLTVNCVTSVTLAGDDFTPFCATNSGEIKNCRVISSKENSDNLITVQTPGGAQLGVAGICLNNTTTGTIVGSGCMARFYAVGRNVAGICLNNEGMIKECYVAAPMDVTSAANVAGICYSNTVDGTVKDCYFANVLNEKSYNCAGIVYTNSGQVEHCYLGETSSMTTTGSASGIVNTNRGTVNYCWADGLLRGASVGLIVCDNYGRVINSYCNNSYTFVTQSTTNSSLYAGGLVAYLYENGSIENCFVHYNRIQRLNNIGNIGGLVGLVSGSAARIKNCYSYETNGTGTFYHTAAGTVTAATDPTDPTFQRCYLLGGSQNEVTQVDADATGFSTLLGYLNTSRETGWATWEASATGMPVLQTYTQSKRRK